MNVTQLVEGIKKVATDSDSEEDLRIGVEVLLKEFFKKLGVTYTPKYERGKKFGILSGRADALWGNVVIEYEKPKKFLAKAGQSEAIEQLKKYLEDLSKGNIDRLISFYGVALDGFHILFLRYSKSKKNWVLTDLLEVNNESILQFIEILRGLIRKPLTPEVLSKDFGIENVISKKAISTLYNKLLNLKNERAEMLFIEWSRLFKQIYGYDFSRVEKHIHELIKLLSLQKAKPNLDKLFFAVHTYYAFVVKLLAAEVAVTLTRGFIRSFVERLYYYSSSQELKKELKKLEEGGTFSEIGIKNFIEGDLFSWYIDVWDNDIEKNIREIIKTLKDYEPATVKLKPEEAQDLLKRLYQYILPKKIRHDLGEYYTPDWLAEFVISEGNYKGNPDTRFLDPACGSGTFLVLAIQKVQELRQEDPIKYSNRDISASILDKILKNIVGFDLNPIAVITARTNFLIALGDLLNYRPPEISIPVYITDSIVTPQTQSTINGIVYYLDTSAGKFEIPKSIIKKGLIDSIFLKIDECIKAKKYSPKEFIELIKEEYGEFENVDILEDLYSKIYKLEKEGKNKIWCRIIKNAFAPIFEEKFDFVIGNPPWVNWEHLPDFYKKDVKSVCDDYNLFPFTGWKGKLGSAKYDISMVFVYTAMDRYLNENGILSFVITQSIFQSNAGYGFRKYWFKKNDHKVYFKVEKVYDLVDVQPFEDASNRTSVLICKKNAETQYPLLYNVWRKKEKIPFDLKLEEVKKRINEEKLTATPVIKTDIQSRWMISKSSEISLIQKLIGKSDYRGWTGCYTEGANGVYFVRILQRFSDNKILIENITDNLKKKVPKQQAIVETDLVYPLLLSANVHKWNIIKGENIIFSAKFIEEVIDEKKFKIKYPKTYTYLTKFKSILEKRKSYVSKLKRQGFPFYTMYGCEEMYAPYKVIWNSMGSKLSAAVGHMVRDKFLGDKIVVPEHVLIFVPFSNRNEAHYLCAVLNSKISEEIVKKYSMVGGKSFASTHILEHLKIPRYDPNNKVHEVLVELSINAHDYSKKNDKKKLNETENKINEYVAQLLSQTKTNHKGLLKFIS